MVDSRPGIITPEAVVLDFDTAGLGTRIVAKVIDLFVQLTALIALQTALGAVVFGAGSFLPEWLFVVLYLFLFALVLLAYPVLFEAYWEGRTPGKAAMGLRVVTVEGVPITIRHALVRMAVGFADFFIPIPGGLLGAATALFTPRTQRLGDLVAGTLVLNERSGIRHSTAVAFAPVAGWETYTAALDVGSLRPPQYALVRSFLLRVSELAPTARLALAHDLAAAVSDQIQQPRIDPERSEPFLICVAAAYQARHNRR